MSLKRFVFEIPKNSRTFYERKSLCESVSVTYVYLRSKSYDLLSLIFVDRYTVHMNKMRCAVAKIAIPVFFFIAISGKNNVMFYGFNNNCCALII